MSVAGVDGCYDGWVAIVLEGTDATTVVEESFSAVWDECNTCDSVLVDVPVGLVSGSKSSEYIRACDTAARKRIASPSSVFQVPIREAVDAWKHAEDARKRDAAREAQREVTGRGLTSQALSLLDKIAEVDTFVGECSDVDDVSNRLAESHPELCFTALNGGRPLSRSKATRHSDAGLADRYDVLDDEFEGDTATTLWEALCQCRNVEAESDEHTPEVTFDDVLDAFVLALTARQDTATLPPSPESDCEIEWPMAMAYAPPGVFDDGDKTKLDAV
ncbi:hypothetical protein C2R22_06695 [Salinigranum rubrum]|uniref:DUF429 domain-containing protein n=1 Tax=Salinigranum rubrum TaxID=755307 RepID=A0A2I8VHI7_9EURY|nr:DUF429 domain-containing protein [Salinigranum rubrum]AUV81385.1 hypothetical protein C2R22_06695 [Salinigranum rubrum]